MRAPELPADEEERLAALHELEILDTPAEERFERITKLACRSLDVPIAALSLIDRDRQWFKSVQGLDVHETSREISFCGHAILGDEPLVVPDASNDPRFHDNPLVTDEPNIAFYAGYPIKARNGAKVGTLCVIDRKPHDLGSDDKQALRDLAALVETELYMSQLSQAQKELIAELDGARRQALIDPLTRLWNREGILNIFERELARAQRNDIHDAVILVDLDHFKNVNDTHGHSAGDAVLREAARRMLSAVRPYDSVGRYGGEEFLVVVVEGTAQDALTVAERIRARFDEGPIKIPGGEVSVSASLGLAPISPGSNVEAQAVIDAADTALYRAKNNGRNRVEIEQS